MIEKHKECLQKVKTFYKTNLKFFIQINMLFFVEIINLVVFNLYVIYLVIIKSKQIKTIWNTYYLFYKLF